MSEISNLRSQQSGYAARLKAHFPKIQNTISHMNYDVSNISRASGHGFSKQIAMQQ